MPYTDPSGIAIPDDLVDRLVPIETIAANPWNPNSMDDFMREKLVKAIRREGFILPILVRPMADPVKRADGIEWEIIDGEHRWDVARAELGMAKVPVLNLGPISDSDAKQITIKANTLRGEFDSVELAKIVKDLVDVLGMAEVSDALPYTQERIQGMIDLLGVSPDALSLPISSGPAGGPAEDDEGFKSFDPSSITFDHKCPRCGFEFNDPKPSQGDS